MVNDVEVKMEFSVATPQSARIVQFRCSGSYNHASSKEPPCCTDAGQSDSNAVPQKLSTQMRQNSKRSVAQLLRMARNWQQRAWLSVGLSAFSVGGLILCWSFHANLYWWLLSGLGVMSSLIELFADVNAVYETRKRIVQMEAESTMD